MDASLIYQKAREALNEWKRELAKNPYLGDKDFRHSVQCYFKQKFTGLDDELGKFGQLIPTILDPLVIENNLAQNLPRVDSYDGIGNFDQKIIHHPSYEKSGNLIYGSGLLEKVSQSGSLLEGLLFMFLSCQAGEAGHNCPIACSAGILRVLQKVADFPEKKAFIEKLIEPSFTTNFTGAQFLTEIQGGSDVGVNATEAVKQSDGTWRIKGEKWFCSNANADLILMTARFNAETVGTKGLGLFLLPRVLSNGALNSYRIKRLKDKIGTRSMASAEIDFDDAYALAVGEPKDGFKLVMENVLHISRLFNTFCVLGMARKAYWIARAYAKHRRAFGHAIQEYPLVQENLAKIKAENTLLLASIFATTHLQDQYDLGFIDGEHNKLLLRLLANLNKYISALWSVEHIHHALDTLAGNGAIESFSILPRLLRDSIVCENWEGTHNTLRMQVLKDIDKYQVDQIFLNHLEQIIESLPQDVEFLPIIRKAKTHLQQNFDALKNLDPQVRLLYIKKIVDQMVYVYVALNGLKESLGYQEISRSKLNCVKFFIFLHLEPQYNPFQPSFLQLIKDIIDESDDYQFQSY